MTIIITCFFDVFAMYVSSGDLNKYYRKVADQLPAWSGKFLAMPGKLYC
jgi:hypothetical protein